jgi:hypothetical protein
MMPDLRKQWHRTKNPKEGEVVLIGFYGETLEVTLLVLEVGYLLVGTRHYKVKRQYFI